MKTKKCSKCGEVKPLSEFWKRKESPDGHNGVCKICRKEYYKRESVKIRRNKKRKEKRHKLGINKPMNKNKKCASFLGVYIAENVLSKIFKNVKKMPYGNPGFDFVCNKGYKIDVKSSILRDNFNRTPRWGFTINKNKTADYFLLLAFNDRKNLVPKHIWLVPGKEINNKVDVSITNKLEFLEKWKQYELDDKLEKVITCCNKIKSGEEALC